MEKLRSEGVAMDGAVYSELISALARMRLGTKASDLLKAANEVWWRGL